MKIKFKEKTCEKISMFILFTLDILLNQTVFQTRQATIYNLSTIVCAVLRATAGRVSAPENWMGPVVASIMRIDFK